MNHADPDWQGWYDRHGPALLLFARQFTHTLAEAEDAMQDGFVRFWNRRGEVADPAAYLYRSVKHAAMDLGRSAGRRRKREQIQARAAAPDHDAPWRLAAKDESEAQLRIEIARLPQPQREVLVSRLWGGLTFEQVALALDIPRSTAAARYAVALNTLRQALPAEEMMHD